ncbi:MAG: hypothetical protein GWM90_03990 [Gemmatimonadetes bacterium]|nr:hypothetical protein [Gemmatimonadota bacterium]NIQ52825.1 hypothetical protein [Gemmatimonadota bacterium]NIU72955.1 hypothetical protein [Gammaproteobacteria bacterium]NIX43310.1 hypothetical protein [Gemmatimonadota bacterium]
MTGEPTFYGVLGGRLDAGLEWGEIVVDGRAGRALSGSEGRWLQGEAELATGTRLGAGALRATLSAFGLRYQRPFTYDAGGVQLRPSLALPVEGLILSVGPLVSVGGWTTDRLEGDLRIAGGDLAVRRPVGGVTLGVSGGALSVDNGVVSGTFWRGGGELLLEGRRWAAAVEIRGQATPLEEELGGGLSLWAGVAPGIRLRADVSRSLRDPLYGTAGSLTLVAGVSVRPFRWSAPEPPPLVAVGPARDGGREVRFALSAPGAEAVAISGDFTDWEPIPMEFRDGRWRITLVLAPGLHHFGFLVDDRWALPPDAPGIVDDGWGRRNASIVVEGP